MIILIDCHYIKGFPPFSMILQFTYTDTYLISELPYPFIGVLECKFNLDGLLQVNYELTIMRIINMIFPYNKKKTHKTSF